MTNAERQKRYRDKQRGGPPLGRWHGHTATSKIAKALNASRTMFYMGQWIAGHAPDMASKIETGEAKVTPIYNRLRIQYIMALARASQKRPDGEGYQLVERRRNGKFVFKWVKA